MLHALLGVLHVSYMDYEARPPESSISRVIRASPT